MQKNILLITFLCSSLILCSQTYDPIPTDSVYWVELESGYDGGNCTYYTYRYIYPVGNIVVKGKTYTEFRSNSITTFTNDFPPWLPCQPTLYTSNDLYILIRNDLANKRVYFYDTNYIHQEKVLFDFNINIGDTVSPESAVCACSEQCPYDTFKVCSIDSIDLGGEYWRRFQIAQTGTAIDTLYFIEGIGANLGFGYNRYCPHEQSTSLICFHNNNLSYSPTLYIGSPFCTTTIGISEEEIDHRFIKPYTINSFYIENEQNNSINIICYDVLGKFIMQRSFEESGYLNFEEAPTGIYFMYILYNSQTIKPYKFIIQH